MKKFCFHRGKKKKTFEFYHRPKLKCQDFFFKWENCENSYNYCNTIYSPLCDTLFPGGVWINWFNKNWNLTIRGMCVIHDNDGDMMQIIIILMIVVFQSRMLIKNLNFYAIFMETKWIITNSNGFNPKNGTQARNSEREKKKELETNKGKFNLLLYLWEFLPPTTILWYHLPTTTGPNNAHVSLSLHFSQID